MTGSLQIKSDKYYAVLNFKDENGKLVWKCPKCGNTDQNTMNVARRTCGYIGSQYWNQIHGNTPEEAAANALRSPPRRSSSKDESRSSPASLSRYAFSSDSSEHENFFISPYIRDIRSSTASRRSEECSIPWFSAFTSDKMSSSSRRHESIRSDSSDAESTYLPILESCLTDSLRTASTDILSS